MRIAFLLAPGHPARSSAMFHDVVRLLRRRRVAVDLVCPDGHLTEVGGIRVAHDLYVLKSGSETALSLAGALHAAGATILNPYPIAAMCRDKIVASKILEEAGIPTPSSYVASDPTELTPLLENGALIVKPYRGSRGRGIRVVRRRSELESVPADGGPVFAQRFHQPDGADRKVYCIGDDLFGVERQWPAATPEEKLGRPFRIGADLREIALRCAVAFGMTLFGFDVIMNGGEPYVVDISSFPGFKGVPNAAARLADYIHSAAERLGQGEPLLAGLVGGEWMRP